MSGKMAENATQTMTGSTSSQAFWFTGLVVMVPPRLPPRRLHCPLWGTSLV